MTVAWSEDAIADLEEIADYWADRSPEFAIKLINELYKAGGSLRSAPRPGRPGRIEGTRELSIPKRSYVLIYRVSREGVTIERVIHTSRDWREI
jgi:toxin ParE1/3/4